MTIESTTLEARCLEAMAEMQHRGLHGSAAWLGEMMSAAASTANTNNANANSAATTSLSQSRFDNPRPPLIEPDTIAIRLGESYLHNHEFKRCTTLLNNEPGFRASFLGLYALYLEGEKMKDVAGASDMALQERSSLAGGGVGGGGGGAGGGAAAASSFAADAGAAHGGAAGVAAAIAGGGGGTGAMHADIPAGLRSNHHAADLDRALQSLVSFSRYLNHNSNSNASSSNNNNNNDSAGSFSPHSVAGSGAAAAGGSGGVADSDDAHNTTTASVGAGSNHTDAASPNPLIREHSVDHAYLHWLHGVVRRERGFRDEALASLQLAVYFEPLLWCAWADLASVVNSEQEVESVLSFVFHANRPRGFNAALRWIGNVFSAVAKADLQLLPAAVSEFEALVAEFKTSAFLHSKLGNARYHRKDFGASREAFESAIACDPLRIDGLDDFSNLLFVAGDKRRLAALAQSSYAVDPFRSETSCVAGNYFAMLRRHAQSVQHFRRAVTIDRRNSSAWTLLGHGYVEVKHTSAAVDAYSTAVEVDRRDYRAWYGLGQIFELLHLYPQALEFYRQAAAVRPHDARMWTVVAGCLEKQNRQGEAIRCLERAEQCEPSTTESYCDLVRRLGEYYAAMRPTHADAVQRAAASYAKLLQSPYSSPDDRVRSLLYLCAARVFESFDLLELMPRSHSMIASLQNQQVPLTSAKMANVDSDGAAGGAGGAAGAGGDKNSNNTTNNRNNAAAAAASPTPRVIPLPQAGSLHFGRSQPKLAGPEMRRARAAALVGEADSMLAHLRDELQRGTSSGVIASIPPHLESYLNAYQHDVDTLRQYVG